LIQRTRFVLRFTDYATVGKGYGRGPWAPIFRPPPSGEITRATSWSWNRYGKRLPPGQRVDKGRSTGPDALKGFKDPLGRLSPLWKSMFQGVRFSARLDQISAKVYTPRCRTKQDRRKGPGKSAGDHLDGEACMKCAELCSADNHMMGKDSGSWRKPPPLGKKADGGYQDQLSPKNISAADTVKGKNGRGTFAKLNARACRQEWPGKGLPSTSQTLTPFPRQDALLAGFYAEWKGVTRRPGLGALGKRSVGQLVCRKDSRVFAGDEDTGSSLAIKFTRRLRRTPSADQ